ncbi:hypothetical protein ACRAWD_31060 [Caulobacter segnis]
MHMTLRELAVNAAKKYGALSTPTGRVVIRWTVDEAASPPMLTTTWRHEVDSPDDERRRRRGFGLDDRARPGPRPGRQGRPRLHAARRGLHPARAAFAEEDESRHAEVSR